VRIGNYLILSVFLGFPVGSPEIPRILFRGVISDLSDNAALRLCELVILDFYMFLLVFPSVLMKFR